MTNKFPDDEVLDQETLERFQIRDRSGIRRLLQDMESKKAFITVHLGGGFSFVTAILAVEDNAVVFDVSPDEAMTRRAAQAEKLDCITQIDRIRVQFRLPGATLSAYNGYRALRSALPDYVIRLQRREYYRLSIPVSEPVWCTLTIEEARETPQRLQFKVANISNGGISLLAPPAEFAFQAGMNFEHCVLQLPNDSAPIESRIKVRNVLHIINSNGITTQQVGCEFIGLSGKSMAQIQRYIFKVERDRRMLETANSG